jgi:Protein of unknown function (DUF3617)
MRTTSFAVAIVLFSAAASAADTYPTLKPGQWEMLTSTARATAASTPIRSTLCIDASVQKEMMEMGAGMRKDMCSKTDIKREGNRYITDAVCKLGESKIVSHSVMTMQGDNGYKTDVTSTYEPPFMGMKESTTTVEGKYVGACKDGLQPGDYVGPTGQKVNISGMASQKSATPGAATTPVAPPPAKK